MFPSSQHAFVGAALPGTATAVPVVLVLPVPVVLVVPVIHCTYHASNSNSSTGGTSNTDSTTTGDTSSTGRVGLLSYFPTFLFVCLLLVLFCLGAGLPVRRGGGAWATRSALQSPVMAATGNDGQASDPIPTIHDHPSDRSSTGRSSTCR